MLFRYLSPLMAISCLMAGLAVSCDSQNSKNVSKSTDSTAIVPDNSGNQSFYDGTSKKTPDAASDKSQARARNEKRASQKTSTDSKATETLAIDYKGRIDDDKAVMSLVFKGNKVTGSYRMCDNKKVVNLSGTVDADGEIHLSGADNSKMNSTHHRRKRSFSGDYKKNGKTLHFRFRKGTYDDNSEVDDIYQ